MTCGVVAQGQDACGGVAPALLRPRRTGARPAPVVWLQQPWVTTSSPRAQNSFAGACPLGCATTPEREERDMIGEKVQHFQGKGTDLSDLRAKIERYLKSEGFVVQSSPSSDHGTVVQAKKGGFLRGIVDADRALSIYIAGNPSDFTVRIGIGRWLEHLGVAAVETLLLSDLFLPIDVAESAWNLEIEDKLARHIESFVG
jgi:hypothetical protein